MEIFSSFFCSLSISSALPDWETTALLVFSLRWHKEYHRVAWRCVVRCSWFAGNRGTAASANERSVSADSVDSLRRDEAKSNREQLHRWTGIHLRLFRMDMPRCRSERDAPIGDRQAEVGRPIGRGFSGDSCWSSMNGDFLIEETILDYHRRFDCRRGSVLPDGRIHWEKISNETDFHSNQESRRRVRATDLPELLIYLGSMCIVVDHLRRDFIENWADAKQSAGFFIVDEFITVLNWIYQAVPNSSIDFVVDGGVWIDIRWITECFITVVTGFFSHSVNVLSLQWSTRDV